MGREYGRKRHGAGKGVEQSVVRIFATMQEPDYELTW